MTMNAGTKFGRYEIRSNLGAGGMDEVYLAEDTELHRKVALKVLPADVVTNKDRIRRLNSSKLLTPERRSTIHSSKPSLQWSICHTCSRLKMLINEYPDWQQTSRLFVRIYRHF